jgi:hypothetical protein
MGYGGNLRIWPNVNGDNYKAERIEQRHFEEKYDTRSLVYEFHGDTLYVWGTRNSDYLAGYPYAECLIDDGRIDVLIKSFWPADVKSESEYIFWAKIPGFKAGTYQVGMSGREYVTLECKGITTQIANIKTEKKVDDTIYDLSGRKIAIGQQPTAKGLFIVNGKKVAVK